MEKRIFGIILTLLGIAGLIAAAVSFANGGTDTRTIKMIVIYVYLARYFSSPVWDSYAVPKM